MLSQPAAACDRLILYLEILLSEIFLARHFNSASLSSSLLRYALCLIHHLKQVDSVATLISIPPNQTHPMVPVAASINPSISPIASGMKRPLQNKSNCPFLDLVSLFFPY